MWRILGLQFSFIVPDVIWQPVADDVLICILFLIKILRIISLQSNQPSHHVHLFMCCPFFRAAADPSARPLQET